ncbi:hypothetical protein M0802_000895 [Mischocyttarus mexicanus]|nr:hypothetical protein M0802_000895 [Mischocyttarus mexicanus]
MCTTEMTESYTMSPSTTVSSSGTTAACLVGSPVHRRTPCRGSPCHGSEVQDDEDVISVGCPSPLPLVVVASSTESEDRLISSREDYVERLSPRRVGYSKTDSAMDSEDNYSSRNSDYRTSNGRSSIRIHESSGGDSVTTLREDEDLEEDEEELESRTSSNGTSATTGATDDYFKPLKRLQMVQMQHSDEEEDRDRDSNERGVKSFSILDILSHRPKAKIVRPWDTVDSTLGHRQHLHHHHHQQQQHQQQQQQHLQNHLHHHHLHHHNHSTNSNNRDLSLMGMSLASMSSTISEPPLSSSSSSGRSSVSDSGSPDPLAHHHHHHHHHHLHAARHHAVHPGLHAAALQQQQQQQQQQFKKKSSQQHGNSQTGQNGKRSTGQGSPLDALFQMTSKTFDAGEHSQGKSRSFFF